MNSKERHLARYHRRRQRRIEKKNKFMQQYANEENVISVEALLEAAFKCKNNVTWKASVQRFMTHLYSRVKKLSTRLHEGRWKSPGFTEFDIIERGHPRHIMSVGIDERTIQRSLCDNYLVPLLTRPLIYDNGATLKGKGYDFSINRFKTHIERFIRKNGPYGYIFLFDFSSYFASIDNNELIYISKKFLINNYLQNLYKQFILAFGSIGLGLGSQVSQISAVFYPNDLDHYVKDELGVKFYGRYMDDGYAIFDARYKAEMFRDLFIRFCENKGLIINKKKCRIINFDKNFIFLKRRCFIDGRRLVMRVDRSVSRKERSRLRKYKELLDNGELTYREVYLNFHCWLCVYYNRKDFFMLLNMIRYYNSLFGKEYGYYKVQKLNSRRNKVLAYMAKRARLNPTEEHKGGSNNGKHHVSVAVG